MRTIQIRLSMAFAVASIIGYLACTGGCSAASASGSQVPAVSLTLSPGDSLLTPGGSLVLNAQLSGLTADLAWSVDGVPGGDATTGIVNAQGTSATYTAPKTEGAHTVAAVASATLSRSIRVTVQTSCVPAPTSAKVADVRSPVYGAAGDGVTDDTWAIQRAIADVAGTGGTVRIPDGTYLINPVIQNGNGLLLGSSMTLSLSSGAVLKAAPTATGSYSVVSLRGLHDVNVVGGTIQGDRDEHLGSSGEWGIGLTITSSRNIVIQGVTARDCWGDGFYVGMASRNVTLCNVTADRNRRNGLSIVGVDGMAVRNSAFRNTVGTEPECGIDVEPNAGETVIRLQVVDCTLSGNRGGGFNGGPAASLANQAFFTGSTIARNQVSGNTKTGITISACSGNTVEGNTVTSTAGTGILLRSGALNQVVKGNTVTGSTGNGIELVACEGSLVTGNTATGNTGYGIYMAAGAGATVTNNQVSGNGKTP